MGRPSSAYRSQLASMFDVRQRTADAEMVMKLRRATGLGVLDCKRILECADSRLYTKLTVAMKSQTDLRLFQDPIVDDPHTKELVEAAYVEAEHELTNRGRGLGHCHVVWAMTKRILREKHGIDWLSPREMNPWILFD